MDIPTHAIMIYRLCFSIIRYRIIYTDKSSISQGIRLEDHVMQEDTLVLEEELENAKDTLAEVQALLLEMKSKQTSLVATKHPRKSTENSLTSNEWLKVFIHNYYIIHLLTIIDSWIEF